MATPASSSNASNTIEITRSVFLAALLFAALLFIAPACSQDASGTAKGRNQSKLEAPVTVATAVQRDVPVQIKAIGKAQAYSTVTVKAQVSGELLSVHFKEGLDVKKGDLLFTIDPRPFEAQLKQAEANLAKDRAQLLNARKQAERYGSVVAKGYVSQEQYDVIAANASALEATVRAGEAAVENAKLSLKYCYIRSPLDGCAGELKIHAGNVIKPNDEEKPLVTINQTSPIFVTFAVPEQHLAAIRKHMGAGTLEVFANVPGNENAPARGELTFLDNAVDFSTGTIQLKARFPNQDKALWPGQFINVGLTLAQRKGAVLVPFEAVQPGQQGQYVFVLKPDLTVEYRIVSLGRTTGSEIIIENGIAPGEIVVTDGQFRLANGSKVKVVEQGKKAE
ncbi:MAG: efflux RND transporter periplasmic adaptor subunit [Syntrophobacteraceae bacterium]